MQAINRTISGIETVRLRTCAYCERQLSIAPSLELKLAMTTGIINGTDAINRTISGIETISMVVTPF